MISGIQIVSASAGSGKTYRLTEELEKAIKAGLRPEGVLATTFTRKAAAELTERVRLRLLGKGMWEAAQGVLDGYVGTVNSVCGRLLNDFAFEAGLSPDQQVIPETDEKEVFNRATDPVLIRHADQLGAIARRLAQDDWSDDVRRLITQARANGLDHIALAKCAEKSWQRLKRILPTPLSDEEEPGLDAALKDAVLAALAKFRDSGDGTQATDKVKHTLRTVEGVLRSGNQLTWQDWARLSKLAPGKASRTTVDPVIDAASHHPVHPRLHRDLEGFIKGIYACAVEAMEAFAEYKRREGLVDYVDQESLAFSLLERDDVRERLAEFLDIVFVDEFQDTSPIELGTFLRLAECVDRSVWVGDQKQAIYAFRGTDPLLMDAAVASLMGRSGPDILPDNWRSRPSLVEFTNHVFSPAFGAKGIPEERVRLNPVRKEKEGQTRALEVWGLASKKKPDTLACLAAGVEALLADPQAHLVEDRVTKELRPLRGSDIAILCRRNAVCLDVADAIEKLGIRVATRRKGLLSTPEAVFTLAALRYLVDQRDTLAVAEMLHLSGEEDWLNKWLADATGDFWKTNPLVSALDKARDILIDLTPWETLDLAMTSGGVDKFVSRWGNPEARLANLDALRGLAKGYEEISRARHNAATAAGLVTYLFKEVAGSDLDQQGEGLDEHAVNVLTYHKAKGLEWPFVVLAELDWMRDVSPFGVNVEPNEKGFDPLHPLEGRWVRYWPWPYGAQQKGVGLDERVDGAPELELAQQQFWAEEARLLYVGMTRARDYLALAVSGSSKKPTQRLDLLQDRTGEVILNISVEEGMNSLECLGKSFDVMLRRFEPRDKPAEGAETKRYGALEPSAPLPVYPSARFSPSKLTPKEGSEELVGKPERIGPRIPVAGTPDVTALGEATHTFFACDDPVQPAETRLARAGEALERWGVRGVEASDLVSASDRLFAYLKERFGDGVPLREYPIHVRVGDQVGSGWVDLIWKTSAGYVVVDHKAYQGGFDVLARHCASFVPQLAMYSRCLEKAFSEKPMACLVHMPFVGAVVSISV